MGLNTEGEGSTMAFLRRGYKVRHFCLLLLLALNPAHVPRYGASCASA